MAGCTGNLAPVSGLGSRAADGYYVVARGDTLYSIAWRNGLDYRAVARWNRIGAPYIIYPGQRLRLSIPRQSRPAREPAASAKSKPRRPAAAAEPTATANSSGGWLWPAAGKVSRRFSAHARGKQGIEVSGRLGEPVTAAAAGRVVYAGNGLRGYDNLIIIKHDSRYLTAYGYNKELLVKEGDRVKAGQKIATMGFSSNRQPALHFELRRNGKPVDPMSYLPER